MLKRGGGWGSTQRFEIGLTQELEIVAILKDGGWHNKVSPFKVGRGRGRKRFYPVLKGKAGSRKMF